MLIKDLNYFERYKEAERLEKNVSKTTVVKTFVIVAIVIGTFLSVSILQVLKLDLEKDIETTENYIHKPEIKEELRMIDMNRKRLEGATKYYEGIVNASTSIATHKQLNKALMDSLFVLLPQGGVVTSFMYGGTSINLELTAPSEDVFAQFVHHLRSHPQVEGIGYDGFVRTGQTEDNKQQYTTTVIIGLLPGGEANE